MAHARGAKNYKKVVLLEVVKEVLPAGAYEWEQVANLYKERSCESDVRDKDDIKRHWVEKLCNKFKKPTGNGGGAKDFFLRCQRVQAKIHKKCESTLMGAHSDDENENDTTGSDDEYKDDGSSESEEESNQEEEEEEDDDTEEVDNVEGIIVPALPPIADEQDTLQVPLRVDGVGGIGNVDEPTVGPAANVAAMNEAAVIDIATALTEAASVTASVKGNEMRIGIFLLNFCYCS